MAEFASNIQSMKSAFNFLHFAIECIGLVNYLRVFSEVIWTQYIVFPLIIYLFWLSFSVSFKNWKSRNSYHYFKLKKQWDQLRLQSMLYTKDVFCTIGQVFFLSSDFGPNQSFLTTRLVKNHWWFFVSSFLKENFVGYRCCFLALLLLKLLLLKEIHFVCFLSLTLDVMLLCFVVQRFLCVDWNPFDIQSPYCLELLLIDVISS